MLTRFSFCPPVSKRGANFALTRCIWSFPVKIAWQDTTLMPISSATSQAVKRQFPQITSWILWTWRSSVNVEGRLSLGSSLTDVLPSLKRLNHLQHCLDSCIPPHKLALAIQMFPLTFSHSLKQNFKHTRFSSGHFIVGSTERVTRLLTS